MTTLGFTFFAFLCVGLAFFVAGRASDGAVAKLMQNRISTLPSFLFLILLPPNHDSVPNLQIFSLHPFHILQKYKKPLPFPPIAHIPPSTMPYRAAPKLLLLLLTIAAAFTTTAWAQALVTQDYIVSINNQTWEVSNSSTPMGWTNLVMPVVTSNEPWAVCL